MRGVLSVSEDAHEFCPLRCSVEAACMQVAAVLHAARPMLLGFSSSVQISSVDKL